MTTQSPYSKYSNNSILTASKEDLTLMLYEGALKFANQALIAMDNNDSGKANDLIQRVEDIVREFQVTLDKQYEISSSMDAMYDYMHRRLVEANLKKDKIILEEVRDYLRDFRDMWKEAMKLAKQG